MTSVRMPAGAFLRIWEGMDTNVHLSPRSGVASVILVGLIAAALVGSVVPLLLAAVAAVVAACPRGDATSTAALSDPMVRSVVDPIAGGVR